MSKAEITIPEVESKTLQKYRINKSFVVTFSVEVYAEGTSHAEDIADEMMQSVEYSESMGCEIDQQDLDIDGEHQNIFDLCLEYVEDYADGLSCEMMGDEITLYKLEESNWEDNYDVYNSEEDCLEQWKEDNDIEDDE